MKSSRSLLRLRGEDGGSGSYLLQSVFVDGSGNACVADIPNGLVKETVAVNGEVSAGSRVDVLGSGFTYPGGVTVDGAGNVFVSDPGSSLVKIDRSDPPTLLALLVVSQRVSPVTLGLGSEAAAFTSFLFLAIIRWYAKAGIPN